MELICIDLLMIMTNGIQIILAVSLMIRGWITSGPAALFFFNVSSFLMKHFTSYK